MGPGPDGVEIRSRNLLWKEQKKHGKRPQERGGRNAGGQEKGRISHEPEMHGIDIGGTTVKLGMFEQDGTLLEKWEIPTRKENGGAHILEDIAAAIKKRQRKGTFDGRF